MNTPLIISLCYTAGWFWCVLLGINGHTILAVTGAVPLILFQLYHIKNRDTAHYIQDVLLACFSVPLGTLLEMVFIQAHLVRYINSGPLLPPLWIVFLYPLFSLFFNHTIKIIQKSYLASFLFGLLGAPLSYFAGLSLGGLTFSYPLAVTWIALGFCWGLFLCLLTKIAKTIEIAAAETLAERDANHVIKLLYDGECPLCKREICHLQKKDDQSKVRFVNISSKEYLPTENNNIDYPEAMSQMHAIDGKGNTITGIPAFAAVYARCQFLVASTLLRLPFLQWLFKPLYTLFAKNRLWITGRVK